MLIIDDLRGELLQEKIKIYKKKIIIDEIMFEQLKMKNYTEKKNDFNKFKFSTFSIFEIYNMITKIMQKCDEKNSNRQRERDRERSIF